MAPISESQDLLKGHQWQGVTHNEFGILKLPGLDYCSSRVQDSQAQGRETGEKDSYPPVVGISRAGRVRLIHD
jgi:hypothetical protein